MDGVHDLGAFLRSRRGRLLPAQVGLPSHGARRTSGLRREEVAALSGVSIDYYTRLEQGRDRRPSYEVLTAISRGLRLTADEYRHLCYLAGLAVPVTPQDTRTVRARTWEIIDVLHPMPAYVLTVAMDVVAWNPAAAATLTDFATVPEHIRNIVWLSFLHPPLRRRWSDWEDTATDLVANLRAQLGRRPGEPRISYLVAELSAASPEFDGWWNRHDVVQRCGASRRLHHPDVGALNVVCETMNIPPADQQLVTFHAADDLTARRLDTLGRTPPAEHPRIRVDDPTAPASSAVAATRTGRNGRGPLHLAR
ncbi:helix-turn-helix transcriptional regulator [Frankia sp. Cas4]|uniref:helix-turn-helix domain-containing protein n=1 Tax=Frankia sp. Cas4 TaxID=3073927 RepID=UPI002AD44A22|nr:helix-turn-helix transcriptional regulator [Frankia sp. Cas4]